MQVYSVSAVRSQSTVDHPDSDSPLARVEQELCALAEHGLVVVGVPLVRLEVVVAVRLQDRRRAILTAGLDLDPHGRVRSGARSPTGVNLNRWYL